MESLGRADSGSNTINGHQKDTQGARPRLLQAVEEKVSSLSGCHPFPSGAHPALPGGETEFFLEFCVLGTGLDFQGWVLVWLCALGQVPPLL